MNSRTPPWNTNQVIISSLKPGFRFVWYIPRQKNGMSMLHRADVENPLQNGLGIPQRHLFLPPMPVSYAIR